MKREVAFETLIRILEEKSTPFSVDNNASYTNILDKIGGARFVLIGEATHATKECYQAARPLRLLSRLVKQLLVK